MQNYHKVFQAATLDLVELMDIDWPAAFTCPSGARQMTADGIMIGHKLCQSHVVRPWEPAADSSETLTPGALLRSRVFVAESDCRRSLQQLTNGATGGLSVEGLAILSETLESLPDGAPERSLLPFLSETEAGDGDQLLAPPKWRSLLRCLGTTAPAIQLLPSVLWVVADELLNSKQLSQQSQESLLDLSPVLHGFLRPCLSAPECNADVLCFMRSLLQARCTCSAQAPFNLRSFQGQLWVRETLHCASAD